MKLLVGLAVVIVAVLVVTSMVYPSFYNERTIECTVTGTDRGYDRDSNSSKYRVYTSDCGTFKNTDSLIRGKFDSADIQGKLKTGQVYTLHVVGPRIPFLSKFPNILDVDSAG